MRRIMQQIFTTSRYQRLLEKEQANSVYFIIMLMVSLYTLNSFFAVNPGGNFWTIAAQNPQFALSLAIFYFSAFAGLAATALGKLYFAQICPLVMWFVAGIEFSMLAGFNTFTGGTVLPVFIILATLLLGLRGVIFGVIFTILTLAIGIALRANLALVPATAASLSDFVTVSLELIGIGGLNYAFLRFIRVSRSEIEVESREERLRLADITTEVAQHISRRMALQDVLSSTVEQVRDSYPDIYHAQIFLIDLPRENAELAASTGEVGRKLIERHHSLAVGGQSVIGQVTAKGQPIVARAGSTETVHRRNELLPETRVEAAFPLRIGDAVIGALDLQSKTPGTFKDTDLPIFQSLADHIAIAIDNARLFDETEKNLQENQRLVEQSREAVAEVERLNQRLTGRFWDDFLSEHDDAATGVSMAFDRPEERQAADWTPTLQEAIQSNRPVQQQADGRRVVALPLRVRGQVIGAMEFELDPSGNLSPEDMNLLEEVGEQLGLAAETTRLFQGTQRLAQREALVNEIATRLQTSNNVETTITEAARSLRDALRAQKVAIRLGPPPGNGTNGGQA